MSEVILYEGKAKSLLGSDDPQVVIQRFKDAATAFNGKKLAQFKGKGALNCALSVALFEFLERAGVATHLIDAPKPAHMRVRKLAIIPLEVVVRQVAAGSLSARLGWEEGTPLVRPIVEFYYKNEALGDPLVTSEHIALLNLATPNTLRTLRERAIQINALLTTRFASANLRLIDLKLEFGHDDQGQLLLGDEISPDTCRLWDSETGARMDKDVFRRDLGELMTVYRQVADRLGVTLS